MQGRGQGSDLKLLVLSANPAEGGKKHGRVTNARGSEWHRL